MIIVFFKSIFTVALDLGSTTDGFFDTSDAVNASITSLTHNFNPVNIMKPVIFPQFHATPIRIILIFVPYQKNFNSLHELFCFLTNRPTIFCLSESRINQKSFINIKLPYYNFMHIDSLAFAVRVAVCISAAVATVQRSCSTPKKNKEKENCYFLFFCIIVIALLYNYP